MSFFAVLLVAGIVALIVWAVRSASGPHGERGVAGPGPAWGHDPAIAEARRRYAAGEISREEYERLEQDLRRR